MTTPGAVLPSDARRVAPRVRRPLPPHRSKFKPWSTTEEHLAALIRREEARKSTTYFATRYLGHEPWRWLDDFTHELEKPLPPGVNVRVVNAPVDHGKSVRLQAVIAKKLAFDRELRIGYGMWTSDLARERTKAVREALLRNELLVRDFWDPQDGPFFTSENDAGAASEFTIRTGWRMDGIATPSVKAFGMDSNVEGDKFHLIVADDPANVSHMSSEADRRLSHQMVVTTLINRLETQPRPGFPNGGELWLVGAPWHERDVYTTAREELRDAVHYVKFDAVLAELGHHPDGTPFAGRPMVRPLCPEKFGPHGEVLLSKGLGTSSLFPLKYRCNVKAFQGGAFRTPKLITRDELDDLGGIDAWSGGFDPNRSDSQESDWTAIVALGRIPRTGGLVWLGAVRKHLKTGWTKHIADHHDRTRARFPTARRRGYYMEDVGFQDDIRIQLHRERADILAHPLKRSTQMDKKTRLTLGLEGWLNVPDRFHVLEGAEHAADFLDEVRAFPWGTFDILDATEAALHPFEPERLTRKFGSLDL